MEEKFVYPQDVETQVSNARKVVGNEKIKLLVWLTIVANVGLGMVTVPFFTSLGVPTFIPIVTQTILMLFIMVFVFRIFIFKEDEKLQEYEDRMTDSFSKYYYLRNVDAGETMVLNDGTEVPVFEFDNGAPVVFIRLLFGSNDNNKAQANRRVLEKIYNILGSHGLEFTQIVGKENFEISPEAKHYMEKIGKIEDRKLAKSMLDITHNLFRISAQTANVDMITIRVKTRFSYQKYDLDGVLSRVLSAFKEERTSFRNISFLQKKPMIEFLADYYGLGAIDLALMRVKDARTLEQAGNKYVEVYKLVDSEGREFEKDSAVYKKVRTASKIKL